MTSHPLSTLLSHGLTDRIDFAEFARVVCSTEKRLVSLLGGHGSKLDPSLSAKARSFVDDAISLLKAAMDVNPDEGVVVRWFNEARLPFLSHATPAEALALGYRDALLKYVESLESGWTG